jgi:hypothetical protein
VGGVAATGGATATGGAVGTGGAENICTPPDVPTDLVKCETCETNQACEGGCQGFTGADQAACKALLDCMRNTGCGELTGVLECYCGPGVDVGSCRTEAFPRTGWCINEVIAAFPAGTSANLIVNGSADPTIPGGAAMTLIQCDYSYCSYPDFGQGADFDCMPFCKAP